MIDLRLTADTWDLDIQVGDILLVSAHEDVIQHIRQRLLAFRGEWFLDLAEGLPWFEEILGKPQNIETVEALLKERIQGSPGVDELTAFAISPVDTQERAIRVDFSVRMVSGETLSSSLELQP